MNVPEMTRSLMEQNLLTDLVKRGFVLYENIDPMTNAYKTLHEKDLDGEEWVTDLYSEVQKQISGYSGVEVRYLKSIDWSHAETPVFVLKGRIKEAQTQFKKLGYQEITKEEYLKAVGPEKAKLDYNIE